MKLPENWLRYVGIALVIGLALVIAIFMIVEVAFGNGMLYTFGVFLVVISVIFGIFTIRAIWFGWRPLKGRSRETEEVHNITTVDLGADTVLAASASWAQPADGSTARKEEGTTVLIDHSDVNIDKRILSGDIPSKSTSRSRITLALPVLMFVIVMVVWGVLKFATHPQVRLLATMLYVALLVMIVSFIWWRHRGWYGRLREYVRRNRAMIIGSVLGVLVIPALIAMIVLNLTDWSFDWLVTALAWCGERVADLVRFLTMSLVTAMVPVVLIAVINLMFAVYKWRTNKIYSAADYIMRVEGVFAKDSPVMKRDMISDIVVEEYFDFMGFRLPFVKVALESLGQDQGFRELTFVPRTFTEHL